MKRNVDLTENRDFSEASGLVGINDFKVIIHEGDAQYQLVLTGNANDRKSKRMVLDFSVPNNHCDCCGSTKAWDFFGGSLCKKCEEYFNNKIVWWRMKELKGENDNRWQRKG